MREILAFLAMTVSLFAEEVGHLDHALVSLYAVQISTEKVLVDKNSQISVLPASCMKVITTAAALHLLGENSRFETHLEYDGKIDSLGMLHGNLYIRGGGDPCLGSSRLPGSLGWKEQIEVWAEAVSHLGIRKIQGKIIGDDALWEKTGANPSWAWEDVGNYYGAGASALSFNENSYTLVFQPAQEVGKEALILQSEPPLASSFFQNEVKTGPEGSGDCACIYGSENSTLRTIRGTVPKGVSTFTIKGALPAPALFCADLLKGALEKKGIPILSQELAEKKRLSFHVTYSPPIKDIVYWTNHKSINLYAEHLLKKIGEVVLKEGSTHAGVCAVKNFWKSQGIDLAGFNMEDGSGLSRKNFVTSKQLVEILLKMKKSPLAATFIESLPKVEGMRAKSGTMSFVKGYVGYGEDVAFAVFVNQCLNSQAANEQIQHFLSHIKNLSK